MSPEVVHARVRGRPEAFNRWLEEDGSVVYRLPTEPHTLACVRLRSGAMWIVDVDGVRYQPRQGFLVSGDGALLDSDLTMQLEPYIVAAVTAEEVRLHQVRKSGQTPRVKE